MKELERLLQEQRALLDRHKAERDTIQGVYETELCEAFKKAHPRKKFSFSKSWDLNKEEHEQITEHWKSKASELLKAQDGEKEELRKRITAKCAEIPEVPKAENFIEWARASVYRGAYRSQGFGELKYSRNAAQQYIDKAEYYGLEAKMDVQEAFINVLVKTTETGLVILEHKPEIDLKEWLKLCWKRGTNPRVYNPFLPYGLEEKLGLDYFGNEVKQS